MGNIWVNYHISLPWIKAILGWFPLLTMIIVRENSEVVIIYPEIWKKQMKRAIFHDHVWLPEATQHKELWSFELVNNFPMSQQIANKMCTVCNATMWRPLSCKWYVITPCNKLYTFPINQMLHIGQNSESEERGSQNRSCQQQMWR